MGNGLSPLAAVSPGLSANVRRARQTDAGAAHALSPAHMRAPQFKPSGVTLFREPGEGDGGEGSPAAPPPPPARATSKTPADFESGFEPEFKPAGAKPLGAAACAKCAKKVFAVCQLKADGGKLYHADCFRCATCGQQLAPASFAVAEEGATYCMKARAAAFLVPATFLVSFHPLSPFSLFSLLSFYSPSLVISDGSRRSSPPHTNRVFFARPALTCHAPRPPVRLRSTRRRTRASRARSRSPRLRSSRAAAGVGGRAVAGGGEDASLAHGRGGRARRWYRYGVGRRRRDGGAGGGGGCVGACGHWPAGG